MVVEGWKRQDGRKLREPDDPDITKGDKNNCFRRSCAC